MLTTRKDPFIMAFENWTADIEKWRLKRSWIFPRRVGETKDGQELWTTWFSFEKYYERKRTYSSEMYSTTTEIARDRYPFGHPEQQITVITYRTDFC